MDLTHPIRSVVPTLDGPILEVLARTTRPLSGLEVHRLAGTGSPNGVRLALARLVAQGVVNADERAHAFFYAANREHVAWPGVEILANLRSTLLDSLRNDLRAWTVQPVNAALFGSTARGDGAVESDIDVLLVRPDDVSEDDPPWAEQVALMRERVTSWTGNHCQAFQVDRARLAEHVRAHDPLVDELGRDAITLAGQDLRAVLRDLPATEADR